RQAPEARLRIGGYLGSQHEPYFFRELDRLKAAQVLVEHIGSPATVAEKVEFLKTIDVLSVPTEFQEPKGLYILEAMANGIPVVQPAHGAFPEHLERTHGGLLVPPRDPVGLSQGLLRMAEPEIRHRYSQQGWLGVREHYHASLLAKRTIEAVEEVSASR
ncbi:MAG: glycosyltransferase family 4 protein, partial [Planctomycetaceae bacterium]|nr:glycosyltransferase family 4 protein [Planctomycetaceae bacterium]